MRVRDGDQGYPAMPPVRETQPVPQDSRPQDATPGRMESGRDQLLSVASGADARAALDVAESLVIVDGRATAWTALERLLHVGAGFVLIATMDQERIPIGAMFLVFVGVLLLSTLCQRASGVQLKPMATPIIVASLLVGVAAGAAALFLEVPRMWFLVFLAACVVGATVSPVVRWVRSGRGGAHLAWSAGTEAFVILSLLDGAGAMTPGYLGSRAGLDQATRDSWITRLRAEYVIMGGHDRRRPLGRDWIRITDTGRERLASMRLELERQASPQVPVG